MCIASEVEISVTLWENKVLQPSLQSGKEIGKEGRVTVLLLGQNLITDELPFPLPNLLDRLGELGRAAVAGPDISHLWEEGATDPNCSWSA